ncbi:Cobalt-zinc-cadmium resistance protein CzcB [Gimesia panareensis]|uniref:Cobalt-zinc-cadmium resistance protein CzcB n=1 Tax=Gimesia panareensis TaxID=2527978 RepID=A0A517Q4S1_9PLAN|nr:efflux RND transporter periplasmic adaptor subunit [Gimesia panareensis]QDT26633.1 Cobalt-zinc-cadmium resistance protein CzcB [Gimesia panareensis]
MRKKHVLLFLLLCVLAGCERPDEEAAEVEEPPEQAARTRGVVHLDQDAQAAIGIVTGKVTTSPQQEMWERLGWLVVPPGQQSVVKAAATGFYLPAIGESKMTVGTAVSQDAPLGSLQIFLSPQEAAQLVVAKEEADLVMNQALVSQRLAEQQLEKLERGGSTSIVAGKRLLELKEIIERNRVAYKEAQEKLPFLPSEPYADSLNLKSVPVKSPLTGLISTMHVVPRQLVVQGDPLWTIEDWSTLWIKVPIFEGDLPGIPHENPAYAVLPGTLSVEQVERVMHPQPTEPGRRTVDIYYRLKNPRGQLRPGQSLLMEIPHGKTEMQATIPRSALIWDGMGNAWVYLQIDPEHFRRQMVETGPGDAETISIMRGLKQGETIVTSGVQSLYGEEFKSDLQAEDDD